MFSIQPYGNQAILINFEQKIDPIINESVIGLKKAIEQAKIKGITYYIPAYCSLVIGYRPQLIEFYTLKLLITRLEVNVSDTFKVSDTSTQSNTNVRQLHIPVCYELPHALDLADLSKEKDLSPQKIIELHTQETYKVYMLGFQPGFAFMGKLPKTLQCNRKVTPRMRVPANSVGIAGLQTGIYPTESPGGWQILGRTPLKIFNPKLENPFYFQAGDEVQFYAITKKAFEEIEKRELSTLQT